MDEAQTRDEFYCDACGGHTFQIRESELLRERIAPWWRQIENPVLRGSIAGLRAADYDSPEAFRTACDARWAALSADLRIRLWSAIRNTDGSPF